MNRERERRIEKDRERKSESERACIHPHLSGLGQVGRAAFPAIVIKQNIVATAAGNPVEVLDSPEHSRSVVLVPWEIAFFLSRSPFLTYLSVSVSHLLLPLLPESVVVNITRRFRYRSAKVSREIREQRQLKTIEGRLEERLCEKKGSRNDGGGESLTRKRVGKMNSRGRGSKEEGWLIIRFYTGVLAATVQLPWLKVRRNFLMYVGESVGRWLASAV